MITTVTFSQAKVCIITNIVINLELFVIIVSTATVQSVTETIQLVTLAGKADVD